MSKCYHPKQSLEFIGWIYIGPSTFFYNRDPIFYCLTCGKHSSNCAYWTYSYSSLSNGMKYELFS